MKALQWILIVGIAVAVGWFAHEYRADIMTFLGSLSSPAQTDDTGTPEEESGTLCAQVITPALNPGTGEIREFPTPCDVPEGWEPIQNDVPGLDLEVQ